MIPTHQKRAYHACCVQWTGKNTDQILGMLNGGSVYGPDAIMVRHERGVTTIYHGWWVCRGENAHIKCYSDEVFKIKYEELKNELPDGES